MKERPILFSAPMVRAILAGTKTQTRRVVKIPEGVRADRIDPSSHGPGWFDIITNTPDGEDAEFMRCPYGGPGDHLWVKETHGYISYDNGDMPTRDIVYRATPFYLMSDRSTPTTEEIPVSAIDGGKWTPSIHMPRWASRITLEITGVRVERLNDIRGIDARDEGLHSYQHFWRDCEFPLGDIAYEPWPGYRWRYSDPKEAFKALWEEVNGAGSWAANPWVWVVEFRRVEAARAAA